MTCDQQPRSHSLLLCNGIIRMERQYLLWLPKVGVILWIPLPSVPSSLQRILVFCPKIRRWTDAEKRRDGRQKAVLIDYMIWLNMTSSPLHSLPPTSLFSSSHSEKHTGGLVISNRFCHWQCRKAKSLVITFLSLDWFEEILARVPASKGQKLQRLKGSHYESSAPWSYSNPWICNMTIFCNFALCTNHFLQLSAHFLYPRFEFPIRTFNSVLIEFLLFRNSQTNQLSRCRTLL